MLSLNINTRACLGYIINTMGALANGGDNNGDCHACAGGII